MNVSVCLSVCLSVRTHISAELHYSFYACCLWPPFGTVRAALQYVMYFRFVDDVMLPIMGLMESLRYRSSLTDYDEFE